MPLIAPLAPIAGEPLKDRCAIPATAPSARKMKEYARFPTLTQTALPNTHRNNMFPARCRMPPWRKM